jgi:hypothetical protein
MLIKTERAPMLAGERGAENTQHNDLRADSEQVLSAAQSKKEICPQSWDELGGNVKPSRVDRRTKRTWRRAAR